MHQMRTIVECKFGSQLYGTATPESDLDLKGVHLPSGRDILLQRGNNVITHNTSDVKNGPDDVDFESFTLLHYFKLLLEVVFFPGFVIGETKKSQQLHSFFLNG